MLVSSAVIGNIQHADHVQSSRELDFLELEWFDTTKRVIREFTRGRREVGFRNLTGRALLHGDILYADEEVCVVLQILPCACIVFKPESTRDMAIVCFEIGNKHVPIFINAQNEIITAYENPLFQQLSKAGFNPKKEERIIEKTDVLMIHNYASANRKIILIKED